MFRNNLKFAIRSLLKNRSYSLINILGLAVGIAAALMLYRMISYEYSFNKDFEEYERIGRVVRYEPFSSGNDNWGPGMPIPAMSLIEETVPGIEMSSRIREIWPNFTLPSDDPMRPAKKFGLGRGDFPLMVQADFLRIFDFPWLTPMATEKMDEPNTIVLTESWARKCFDSVEGAVGQVMMMDNIYPLTVVGVIADLPSNVDFSAPYFISYQTIEGKEDYLFYNDRWGSTSSNDQMYLMLQENASMPAVEEALSLVGKEEYSEDGEQKNFHHFQPLSDLHYNEEIGHSGTHITSINRLKVLALIGLLILVMACFNFINLANAQATLRAKEVGVRKTLGGRRGQLAIQFMTETALTVVMALVLGIGLAHFATPLLQKVSEVPTDQSIFQGRDTIYFLVGTAVLVSLLAGLYPSLALASFKPVEALKNKLQSSIVAATSVRKALVVLQFVIAQALIIGIIIALVQLNYIRKQDLGFQDDLVFTFGFNSDSSTIARQSALKQSLLQLPEVESVSLNSDQPFSGSTWMSNFRFHDRPEDEEYGITLKFCDEDYQDTYQIKMIAGRWLNPSDTMREAVVNKMLIGKLGYASADDILGKTINTGGRKLEIVGITEDFHAHSFRDAHLPLLMSTRKVFYWDAGVRIRPDKVGTAVASIQNVYDRILPEQIFDGRFLEENIAMFYEDDQRLASACWGFGLLAIFICCLGLFGLAAHTAARRRKEIGVRKVLGARVTSLVTLLSRDFILLVILAFVVAAPLAWYFMSAWLDDFVFRVEMPWWAYALACFVTVLIAMMTVGFQTLRAAVANPINSLRSE
ncbi:MAG: ABC transporter permease [Saprospiraceae bacterium]|nr:ABC transporter permease [Saprospiraceae bacterium]